MSLASLKGNYSFPKVILNITNFLKKNPTTKITIVDPLFKN